MHAYVDISIFSTPAIALGNATGVIELASPPEIGKPISWPSGEHLVPQAVLHLLQNDVITNIESGSPVQGADLALVTAGLVHTCEGEAMQTVECLKAAYGLFFCKY